MGINKKVSLMNKEYLTLVLLVTLILSFFGFISDLGFRFSEYLSELPNFNLIISYFLIYLGLTVVYRRIRILGFSKVSHALRTYIAIALAMSGVYYLINISHDGCFLFPKEALNLPNILDFIYFSFVTVTTVGYGDIVPLHTFVRVLVLLQVLSGLILILVIAGKNNKKN